MARKMRDSGVEWIGEVPEGWEIGRIRSLFREVSERYDAQSNNQLPLLSVSEYYGVAKREDKIKTGEVLVRAESLDGYKVCRAGDIVSNIMLAWKGALGFSPLSGIVSPAYSVYRPLKDVCSKYFHYLFRTDRYTDVFNKYSTGIIASRLRLYSPEFYAIPAIIPPLPEQRRIADYLDEKCAAIDGAVGELKRGIEDCKAWKKAIIFEAVTGKANVLAASACAKATADKKSAKVAKRPMRDSGIPWIGDIPKGWRVSRVKEVATIKTGNTPDKQYQNEYYSTDSGVPWIKAENLGFMVPISQTAEYLTEKGVKQGRIFPPRTVFVCCIASIGKVGYSEKVASCNQQLNALVFNSRMYWKYGFYVTIAAEEEYLVRASGNVVKILNSSEQGLIAVPLPSIPEQRAIADHLDEKCAAIDAMVAEKEALIADLEAYKKSLIYETVTGKREVA